ncbi:MAG: hypothetical protein RIG68_09020 [Imperialibacter sp.]|uniref:hypothetical protein n=1 Tax=Imperialibacter sp. TaxID=2038411 RepID=UPI0032EDA735
MFGLFKTKPLPNYHVYATEIDKYRHIINVLKNNGGKYLLVYHFNNTRQEAEQLLTAAQLAYSHDLASGSQVLLAESEMLLKTVWPVDYSVIVLEIYPLSNRGLGLMTKAAQLSHSLEFYAALDSPFFKLFGGERLASLLPKLGMESDEAISHPMVNKSIQRAQQKIEDKLPFEVTERESIERWMEVNKIQSFS